MVFSTSETQGCKDILNILDFYELLSLVETVTKKKVKVTSKTEAIKAVILCSENAFQLLKRQKIRRDTLLQYLVNKEIKMKDEEDTSSSIPASSASSNSSQTSASTTYQNDRHGSFENRKEQEEHKQKLPELRDQSLEKGVHVKTEIKQKTDGHLSKGQENILVQTFCDTENGAKKNGTPVDGHLDEQCLTTPISVIQSHCDSSLNKPELQLLGETFSKWFYENVNSFNPAFEQKPADFGPHHFWSDAFLLLISHTTGISEERFEGAILTAQRFVAFTKDELLLFNPNISPEGVLVKSDPYGMVMILVCGTIHRDHSCLGIFQQLFALIKDPRFENNWKIKQTKLNVKTSSVASMPKLDANPEKQMELVPK
ncbi:uncharacterized protein C3orf38 homolog isoform X2 [Dreissena polymorpha]|uniref:uncharacterized protein C3orf38 homolog isoform X2 n=1 Tax=Dreissena polymorpha TaxID=45954 RepID=UPI002265095E|nr:uncharacterized protein C3orf38 homolog isoform X2 [Dreissena polymorpha]